MLAAKLDRFMMIWGNGQGKKMSEELMVLTRASWTMWLFFFPCTILESSGVPPAEVVGFCPKLSSIALCEVHSLPGTVYWCGEREMPCSRTSAVHGHVQSRVLFQTMISLTAGSGANAAPRRSSVESLKPSVTLWQWATRASFGFPACTGAVSQSILWSRSCQDHSPFHPVCCTPSRIRGSDWCCWRSVAMGRWEGCPGAPWELQQSVWLQLPSQLCSVCFPKSASPLSWSMPRADYPSNHQLHVFMMCASDLPAVWTSLRHLHDVIFASKLYRHSVLSTAVAEVGCVIGKKYLITLYFSIFPSSIKDLSSVLLRKHWVGSVSICRAELPWKPGSDCPKMMADKGHCSGLGVTTSHWSLLFTQLVHTNKRNELDWCAVRCEGFFSICLCFGGKCDALWGSELGWKWTFTGCEV